MPFRPTVLWVLALSLMAGWCQSSLAQVRGTDHRILQPGGVISLALRSKAIQQDVGIYGNAAILDEIKKLQEVMIKEYREESRNASKEDRDNPDFIIARVDAKLNPQLEKLLKPEQFHRLKQIQWQELGNGVLLETEMAKLLEITSEQQAKIVAAHNEFFKGLYANNGKQVDQAAADVLRAAKYKQLKETVTASQQAKLKELLGKPFRSVPLFTDEQRPIATDRPYRGIDRKQQSLMSLVLRKAVDKELNVSADQVVEVRKLLTPLSDELASLPPEKLRDEQVVAKLYAGYAFEVKGILQPDQFTRLQQIRWQAQGSGAFADPELIKLLDLDESQRRRFTTLNLETGRNLATTMNPKDPQEFADEVKALAGVHHELAAEQGQIKEILSPEQWEKFENLKGKPFDLDQLINWSPSGKRR
jgi:hypothetical protein